MSKVAIVTDTNGSITKEEGQKLGIHVLAMPFFIDEKLYYDGIDLSQEGFYQKLVSGSDVSTSQPSPADIIELWEGLLKEYDEVVYIPMSSGLSNSCATATALAQEYDGKVQVINNQRIALTQKSSALDAVALAQKGKNASEIKELLEQERLESSIYIMVDTLEYLKKGGRITPAAAMIGTVLKLKPVLQIQGEKLDAFAKARSQKLAKKIMVDAMKDDFEKRFASAYKDGKMRLGVCHSANEEEAKIFAEELASVFPSCTIEIAPLPLSVACHIGQGSLAITSAKITE